jgi:hypothetical protein
MKTLERDIQAACLDYLNILPGCIAWRMNTGAHAIPATGRNTRRFVRFGFKGLSDIIGIIGGRFLAVEVKRRGNKPTNEQRGYLEVVNQHGGVGLWTVSVESLESQLIERGMIEPKVRR